jgi:hypothetical protein
MMPAMMEQAAMDQVCDAGGICVDANLKRIDVQVSVSLDSERRPVIAAPASITVWGVPTTPDDSTWTVTWTISGPSSVVFDNENGIVFPSPPPNGVTTMLWPADPSKPTQRTASIVNQVSQWQGQAQPFSYTINVYEEILKTTASHDPTIVVTPEPIGG